MRKKKPRPQDESSQWKAYQQAIDIYNNAKEKKDFDLARQWATRAAELGNPNGWNLIGAMYRKGELGEVNHEESQRLFRLAADAGAYVAAQNLGDIYYNGNGAEENDALALQWYLRALKYGRSDVDNYVRLRVAWLYLHGNDVLYHPRRARAILEEIKHDSTLHDSSLYELGQLWQEGVAGSQCVITAARYFGMAKSAGRSEAETAYAEIIEDARTAYTKRINQIIADAPLTDIIIACIGTYGFQPYLTNAFFRLASLDIAFVDDEDEFHELTVDELGLQLKLRRENASFSALGEKLSHDQNWSLQSVTFTPITSARKGGALPFNLDWQHETLESAITKLGTNYHCLEEGRSATFYHSSSLAIALTFAGNEKGLHKVDVAHLGSASAFGLPFHDEWPLFVEHLKEDLAARPDCISALADLGLHAQKVTQENGDTYRIANLDDVSLRLALDKLAERLSQLDCEVEPVVVDPPASSDDIDEIEETLGKRLHPQLRWLFSQVSRRVSFSWKHMWHKEFPGQLNSIHSGSLEWNLEDLPWLDERLQSWLSDHENAFHQTWETTTAFHHVANGDLWTMTASPEMDGRILYFDHHEPYGHPFHLAYNIEDLLARMLVLGCPGSEYWQWINFVGDAENSVIDPECETAKVWRIWIG